MIWDWRKRFLNLSKYLITIFFQETDSAVSWDGCPDALLDCLRQGPKSWSWFQGIYVTIFLSFCIFHIFIFLQVMIECRLQDDDRDKPRDNTCIIFKFHSATGEIEMNLGALAAYDPSGSLTEHLASLKIRSPATVIYQICLFKNLFWSI